jgi:membrane protein required for colicin V production
MIMEFQILDVLVVVVLIASIWHAVAHGLVNESLSILSWVAAALATLWFGPWIAATMEHTISPAWLGEVVGYAAVFLAVVIPLSFVTARVAQNVKKSAVGPLDASLGAAFGVVQGLAGIGIAYLVFTMIVPLDSQPGWVAKAKLLPLVSGSAEVVASIVPDQHVDDRDVTPRDKDAAAAPEKTAKKPDENKVTAGNPANSEAKPAKKAAVKKTVKKSYGAKDREALDKLIETTDDGKSGKP